MPWRLLAVVAGLGCWTAIWWPTWSLLVLLVSCGSGHTLTSSSSFCEIVFCPLDACICACPPIFPPFVVALFLGPDSTTMQIPDGREGPGLLHLFCGHTGPVDGLFKHFQCQRHPADCGGRHCLWGVGVALLLRAGHQLWGRGRGGPDRAGRRRGCRGRQRQRRWHLWWSEERTSCQPRHCHLRLGRPWWSPGRGVMRVDYMGCLSAAAVILAPAEFICTFCGPVASWLSVLCLALLPCCRVQLPLSQGVNCPTFLSPVNLFYLSGCTRPRQ